MIKTLLLLPVLFAVLGCSRPSAYQADIYRDARDAEVIVLADVRRDGNRERFFAREVLKGTLGSAFRFHIGEEIAPSLEGVLSTGSGDPSVDAVLLFYKQHLGVLGHSGLWTVQKGRILGLTGTDAELAAFITRLKTQTSQPSASTR